MDVALGAIGPPASSLRPMRFWGERFSYRSRKAPLIQRGGNQESEFPWRIGVGVIFRIPFSRHAFAVGKWTGEQPHENVDGIPALSLRPLENPEDYFHVDERQDERPAG
jgi:hypothetical protein